MRSIMTTISCLVIASASVLYIAATSFAEPPSAEKGKAVQSKKTDVAKTTTKKATTMPKW